MRYEGDLIRESLPLWSADGYITSIKPSDMEVPNPMAVY